MASDPMKPGGNIIYLDDARVAFYVVPKAACTSIKRLLAHNYMEGVDPSWKLALKRLRETTGDRKNYFKIAVCRNPWIRAQSTYVDKLVENIPKARLEAHGFYKGMLFDRFVCVLAGLKDTEHLDKHLKSQYLTIFRDGPPDFLGRVETLYRDWKTIRKIMIARGGRKLPKLEIMNATSFPKPEYTRDTFGMIAKRYAEDVKLLGYEEICYGS